MRPPSAEQTRRDRLLDAVPILCVATGITIICIVNQRSGHDWGDDFSLYLRQAKGIVDGNVQRVLDDNRFSVDYSSWHTFSPYAYPWGWPLLAAPIYAIWGLNYHVLKIVEALFFGGFLVLWNSVTARRTTQRAGLLLVLAIGLSVAYVGWTDTVLSEFPFLFFVGLTWWWLDRCRDRESFTEGRLWPLVVLGVLAAYTYSVRRDGLAMIAAIGLVHLVDVATIVRSSRSLHVATRAVDWRRLATPYVSGFVFVGLLQLVLPSVLFQKYPDAGWKQIKPNVIWFRDILAENIGLKDQGVTQWELLGSDRLAKYVFTLFVILSVVGLLLCCATRLRDDAPLIGYAVVVCLIVGVQPFHEGRYLFSITPLMFYFAYQAVAIIGTGLAKDERIPRVAAAMFIAVFVTTGATDLYRRTVNRLDTGNYIVWGPEDPAAREMFSAVRQFVGPDDVVSFFRARAMNLYSDRRSVQLTTIPDLLAGADYYVMEKNSTYSQVLLSDTDAATNGFVKVWENTHFVLWSIAA